MIILTISIVSEEIPKQFLRALATRLLSNSKAFSFARGKHSPGNFCDEAKFLEASMFLWIISIKLAWERWRSSGSLAAAINLQSDSSYPVAFFHLRHFFLNSISVATKKSFFCSLKAFLSQSWKRIIEFQTLNSAKGKINWERAFMLRSLTPFMTA